MPAPPTFDPALGDTVLPRERSDAPGPSSSSGPMHLPPGPSASPSRDPKEESTIAHIPDASASSYVIMYAPTRTMTIIGRKTWPRTRREVCPHFELQPEIPSDTCLSVHLPRTNLDKQGLIEARKKTTIRGKMLSGPQQYLWDTTEFTEGCQTKTVDIVDWTNQNHPVAKFSRMLSSICRHDNDLHWDNRSFASMKKSDKKSDHAYTW